MPIHQNVSIKKRNRDDRNADQKKQIMPTSQQQSSIYLTDLPSNVLVQILARLPLRTLFVARSVCKTFAFLTAAQILVFQFEDSNGLSFLIRMADEFLDYENSQPKPLFQLPEIPSKTNTPFLVNSCNGLLYFCQNGPYNYFSLVCNPVTSEYIIISDVDPKMKLDSQTKGLWLGFSPCTNRYKVLKIFCWKNAAGLNEVAAQVFVIGSYSWRDVDDTPPFICWDLCQTQHVNGLMYWHDGMSIISFDFEREKFGEVSLPPEFQDEGFMTKCATSVGVLGGCLCFSCNNSDAHRVDLWVMRNCGNGESWTKKFVVDTLTLEPRGRPVYGQFQPLQFLGNGEILMRWSRDTLVYYDPRFNTLRYFKMHRGDSGHKVVALTPSFVPLKDALKVKKVLTQLRPRGDEEEL